MTNCNGCRTKPPAKMSDRVRSHVGLVKVTELLPNYTGWMVIEFPFKDLRHAENMRPTDFKEKVKLCPRCAHHIGFTVRQLEGGYLR